MFDHFSTSYAWIQKARDTKRDNCSVRTQYSIVVHYRALLVKENKVDLLYLHWY